MSAEAMLLANRKVLTRACPAMAAVAVGLLLTPPLGSGGGKASRVVDGTFLCSTRSVGSGFWGIEVVESPPEVGQDPRTQLTGFAARVFTLNPGPPNAEVATIAAGRSPSGIWIGRDHCRRSVMRIRLTRTGLDGGRFSGFFTEYDCETPRRVLIRVRAIFRGRSALAPSGRSLAARGRVQHAYVAVSAYPTRKPIAYADVSSERARMFVASSRCIKE
jgi:hypothetical protein